MAEALHLLAASADDLPTLSALLQDATVRAADVGYDAKVRRFALLANRYRWEARERSRVRSALAIEGVLRIQRQRWPADPETVLDLLAITADGDRLDLAFAGGASLRLTVEAIDLRLDDLTGPWGTGRTPAHD